LWRRCPRPFNFTQQQNALRAIDHNHIIMHMDCVCEPSDQNHVVPIGSKGLVWSTMSLSPRSAPRIGVELARCHAGREQIRASPSQIDRSTSASAQRRRAPARSSSAHGGGAVAAVHRIGRYICVFPLRICYHAPCWCVCVIEWSVSGSPAYDVDGITQRVCKTLTEASACTIPRRTGHARTATQIYMALPRKKKSWHARAE
jgi:hypothetical protein